MNIVPAGDSALLVELTDFKLAQGLRHELEKISCQGIVEMVPGYSSLLIGFNPLVLDADKLIAEIERCAKGSLPEEVFKEYEIFVDYDGADLDAVAVETGLSVAEVIRRHTEAVYTVAFLGFAPGFPYLVGLDAKLQVPRLKTPRAKVPAGAVAIADQFTGIYPQASPGGWRILGNTSTRLFDVDRPRPALLTPGDHVRFRVRR